MIVKIQRPILGEPMWLIYNQDRSYMTHTHESEVPNYIKDLMGGEFKIYVEVTLTPLGGLFEVNRVADQAW